MYMQRFRKQIKRVEAISSQSNKLCHPNYGTIASQSEKCSSHGLYGSYASYALMYIDKVLKHAQSFPLQLCNIIYSPLEHMNVCVHAQTV